MNYPCYYRMARLDEGEIAAVCMTGQSIVDQLEYLTRFAPQSHEEYQVWVHGIDLQIAHLLQDVAVLLPPEAYDLVRRALAARQTVLYRPVEPCQEGVSHG